MEASLKRLQGNYIDLYWVHTWGGVTPVEEVMRGLDDIVRQGKGSLRRHLGRSSLVDRAGKYSGGASRDTVHRVADRVQPQ